MAVKVGDVVAWDKVPSGALVLVKSDYALRVGDMGHLVCLRGNIKMEWARAGAWGGWSFDDGEVVDEGPATIIALDVPADATADDLRTLAERFEIREVVTRMPACVHIMASSIEVEGPDFSWEWAARRLHRAGWRPGMTAEDAARMLAEVRDGEV